MDEKNKTIDMKEAWEIFMKLCEEFPELYGKYAEMVEKDIEENGSEIEISEEEKNRTFEKILNRIKSEGWE